MNKKKYITKRDGERVVFYYGKIVNAIMKANHSVSSQYRCSENVAKEIANEIYQSSNTFSVEQVQDIVQKSLAKRGYEELAFSYVKYRQQREVLRNASTMEQQIFSIIDQSNEELRDENSNKNTAYASTQRDYMAGEVSRTLSSKYLIPAELIKAHKEGVLHFHDMDYQIQSIFNCCLINIQDMLDNGTVMNGKAIESPKSFQVACTVMTQIIAAVASNQYGGQSIDIRHLGKYLRKTYDKAVKHYQEICPENAELLARDKMMEELKSGVQTIQYQVNTLMTTNGQSPFVTLFLNIVEGDEYEEEVALIVHEMLRQRLQGIKNEQGVFVTPAFPKLIYVLYEHNNLTGGKYDYITKLAVQCSAKRMYPDYISAKKMKENYEGNVFSCMGCRSFLSPWKDKDGKYKFEGRFNQGVVSINLPQIALLANGNMDKFWSLLNERLELCYQALMVKHNRLKGTTSDVSPIHWQNGAIARLKPGETITPYLLNGYSTISLGYIGIYEMVYAMLGKSHTTPEGRDFSMKVMNHMKSKCEEWKAKTSIGFGLYGTPAESLCYRFAKIDAEKFGFVKNITDKGYYTNSYHVDVREKVDAFSKFTFESEFQKISTGGCISYVEVPNMAHNLEALEAIVHFIYDNIQYAEFNTKSDYCHECGYDGEIVINKDGDWECPNCHNKQREKLTVVRRTCGYIGENFWNKGKTKEIASRVTHL